MTKHTILFLAANPTGTDRLALDREARAIQIELERSRFRDNFELVSRWAVERLDLLRELRSLRPTVVHFSGHGASDGLRCVPGPNRDVVIATGGAEQPERGLYFQGADGLSEIVSAHALVQVLEAAGSSVKLLILSACYTDQHAEAMLAHVSFVVGMKGQIKDDVARNFAIGFYGGLGERESVAAAFRQGCAAIGLDGFADSTRPQLWARSEMESEHFVIATQSVSTAAHACRVHAIEQIVSSRERPSETPGVNRKIGRSAAVLAAFILTATAISLTTLTCDSNGDIYVDCQTSAAVLLDGKHMGTSPIWLRARGHHVIQCRSENRYDTIKWSQQIDIAPHGELRLVLPPPNPAHPTPTPAPGGSSPRGGDPCGDPCHGWPEPKQ